MKNTIVENVGKYNNQTGLQVDSFLGGMHRVIYILNNLLSFTRYNGEECKHSDFTGVIIYDRETAARINADKQAGRGFRYRNEWVDAARMERTEKSLADFSKENFNAWMEANPESEFYQHDARATAMFWEAFEDLSDALKNQLILVVNDFGTGNHTFDTVEKRFTSIEDFRARALVHLQRCEYYGAYDITQKQDFVPIDEWLCKIVKKHERFSKYNYVKAGSLYAYDKKAK